VADATTCTTFLCDYVHTQFDPAHLLSELGFSIVFEIIEAVVIYVLWRKFIKPRWFAQAHRQFDEEHGLNHSPPSVVTNPCTCPHNDTINVPGTGTLIEEVPV
jgi:hypothetical protein